MESKEVKGKGKNKYQVERIKTKQRNKQKKFQRYKQGETVLINHKLKRHYRVRERIENKK
jgi:uncharacterized protein YbaR (Trm112 family)